MRWLLRAIYELARDIAVTGTGLLIIWRQILYAPTHPNGLLLGTGLTMTVPSVWAHVRALLPGGESTSAHSPDAFGGGGASSPPSSSPPPQPSPPQPSAGG